MIDKMFAKRLAKNKIPGKLKIRNMSAEEVKMRISNIEECQHALALLAQHEKETYYKDMFEYSEKMLREYKALLLDLIEGKS